MGSEIKIVICACGQGFVTLSQRLREDYKNNWRRITYYDSLGKALPQPLIISLFENSRHGF